MRCFEKLATSKIEVEQIRLQEEFCKQDRQQDASHLFEPITKNNAGTSQKQLKESHDSLKLFKIILKNLYKKNKVKQLYTLTHLYPNLTTNKTSRKK